MEHWSEAKPLPQGEAAQQIEIYYLQYTYFGGGGQTVKGNH